MITDVGLLTWVLTWELRAPFSCGTHILVSPLFTGSQLDRKFGEGINGNGDTAACLAFRDFYRGLG